jgi:hypothetical protein
MFGWLGRWGGSKALTSAVGIAKGCGVAGWGLQAVGVASPLSLATDPCRHPAGSCSGRSGSPAHFNALLMKPLDSITRP